MSLWSVVRRKLIFGTEEMLLVRKRLLVSVTYFPQLQYILLQQKFYSTNNANINQPNQLIYQKNSNKCLGNVVRLKSTYVFVFLYPCRGYYDFSQKLATR